MATEGARQRYMRRSTFRVSCAASGTERPRRPHCKRRSWHLTQHSDASRWMPNPFSFFAASGLCTPPDLAFAAMAVCLFCNPLSKAKVVPKITKCHP